MPVKKFRKLLVANRGEIAIRILRAAAELKIKTVAVYTFEDRYSLHCYKGDESYQIGIDTEPLKPYLDIEEIIRIAKLNEVDAIHPGYGFLSENVNFARRCAEERITFVGPRPDVMEKLGDKVAAKKIAREVNVPLIPDSRIKLQKLSDAIAEAEFVGYPIMLKASAGGGGRGMRVVKNETELSTAFTDARSEALKAFGDDTVFIEKYVENPKHIEVQVLGDNFGNIVHLFERDCSVQRRFQKVIEVAPSSLKTETRHKLFEYALRIAKHVQYNNAGTVEFLVDSQDNIYFIEVNPRIQVEHTITEEITGIDLVRSQILIALGVELTHAQIFLHSQDDVKCNGFAIQCRITTEDPENDFKPDYGTLVAYRNAGGFGIRLDEGSSYSGVKISPFFDSMLVKVSAWSRTLKGATRRMNRTLLEFRIRGVKTNIPFLVNVMENEDFQAGKATVGFITQNPGLLVPRWGYDKDRGTKLMRYLAELQVNGNPDIKSFEPDRKFRKAITPAFDVSAPYPKGYKDLLNELGRDKFLEYIGQGKRIAQPGKEVNNGAVLYTDTTLRDAHQSLFATRLRNADMLHVAKGIAKIHPQIFSMEVWGGATFDVCMRFLHEDPWERLRLLRKAMPNMLLQMLFRGSNAVGYAAYPDNLVIKFIEKSAENGIDIFRIFDSLNWIDGMKMSIKAVREQTQSIAEACICYTGDILDPARQKFSLPYYLELAKQLEDEGAHILAIKDMAGLLKPYAAEKLIGELKKTIKIPIHLHTHDTSSIQSATYLKAIEAGVDAIDVALGSMSGLTSQPNFNSIVAMMKGQKRENPFDLDSLNDYSNYFEVVREYYYPFESELKAGTAEVYEHEIPGGQYSNLLPQARSLGLEDKLDLIKHNYHVVNQLFGDVVKVTPSSKVVGDMALFMTSNQLTAEDIFKKGDTLAFPDSVKQMFRGELGQPYGGFPKDLQAIILNGETPYSGRPNAYLAPTDFERELTEFRKKYDDKQTMEDFLSMKMYLKVFDEFYNYKKVFGSVWQLPTPAFYYPMKPNEEIIVGIEPGKNVLIRFMYVGEPNEDGMRNVFFRINGQTRSVSIRDRKINVKKTEHYKVAAAGNVGAPLQGKLVKIYVKEGEKLSKNQPLFVIEAMKMESTITSPVAGTVKKVHLPEGVMVEQDDCVVSIV